MPRGREWTEREDRALVRQLIDRPDRNAPGDAVQHPHPRQAGLAHLRRADKVEVGIGAAAHAFLRSLGLTEAATSPAKSRAFPPAVTAEVVRGLGMVDEGADAKVGVIGAKAVNQRP